MQSINTWQQLQEALNAQLIKDEESSFALVPLKGALQPADLLSLRHAVRLCDYVVTVQLEPTDGSELDYIEKTGAQLYVHNIAPSQGVSVTAHGMDASLFMQALVKIMPSVVAVSVDHLALYQLVKSFEQAYEGFFTLLEPETPQSLYDASQIEIQAVVSKMQQLIYQGVIDLAKLTEFVVAELAQIGDVKMLKLQYLDDFSEVRGVIEREAILQIELARNNQNVSFVQKLHIQ